MSTYGTLQQHRRARPTQPPTDGPSLLAASTPLRTPSALRPALFHPRASVPVTLTPTTAVAYAPSPARASLPLAHSPPHRNPFEALPASAFDSFVSNLTTSIRAALEPSPEQRRQLPSERRRRDREEHAREREEARRERERRAAERAEEQEREERELHEEQEREERDVFGKVKELPPAATAPASDADADTGADEPIVADFACPSPSRSPSAAPLEMREASSALSRTPLFVPHSAGTTSASDHEHEHDDREGTYGLDTTAGSSSPFASRAASPDAAVEGAPLDEHTENLYDEAEQPHAVELEFAHEHEPEQVWDEDAIGEGIEEVDRAMAEADDDSDVEINDAYRDPFGRPLRYAAEGNDNDEEEEGEYGSAPSEYGYAEEDVAASDDIDIGVGVDVEAGTEDASAPALPPSAADSPAPDPEGAPSWSPAPGAVEPAATAATPVEYPSDGATKRTKGGTELLELGSSSDLESEAEAEAEGAPARRPRPRRAVYGDAGLQHAVEESEREEDPALELEEEEERGEAAVEQPHVDAAMLDALPPWLTAGVVGAEPTLPEGCPPAVAELDIDIDVEAEAEEGGGVSSAAWADVEDEGEEEGEGEYRDSHGDEWYGEGMPGDEVEMGREGSGEEGEEQELVGEEEDAVMADGEAEVEEEDMGDEEPAPQHGEELLEVEQARNPLEGVYADEDSEDLRPRIPYEAKGKARAPPTPSDLSRRGSRSPSTSRSPSPFDLDIAISRWVAFGATELPRHSPSELIQLRDQFLLQLVRAVESDTADEPIGLFIQRQVRDVEEVFTEMTGRPIDLSDDEDDDDGAREAAVAEGHGERDREDLVLSDGSDDVEQRGRIDHAEPNDDDDEEGETYALPGSPLSTRTMSSSSPPPAPASRSRSATPAASASGSASDAEDPADRSAYFPDLADEPAGAASAAAEARLAEIASELVEMRGDGFDGGLRVERSAMEEEHEAEEAELWQAADEGDRLQGDVQVDDGSRSDNEQADNRQDDDDDDVLIVEATSFTETVEVTETLEPSVDASLPQTALDAAPSSSPRDAGIADADEPALGREAEAIEVEQDEPASAVGPEQEVVPQPVEAETVAGPESPVAHDAELLPAPAPAPAPEPAPAPAPAPEPAPAPADAPAPEADSPVAPSSPPHASFAPSAPLDAAPDSPLVPSTREAESTGDPRIPSSTIAAPHFSSHFRLEDRPAMSLSSPLPYPPVRAEHSVDSPVHSDDNLDDQVDEAPIRVGVTDDEMRDGAFVGRLVPLASMQDGSPTRAKEARDLPDGGEGESEPAQGGLTILDDDASFPPSRPGELEALVAPPQVPHGQGHERVVLGATPPPADYQADEQHLPIVDGVAPPQNLAIVPESAPRTPPPAPAPEPARQVAQPPAEMSSASAAEEPAAPLASYAPSAPVGPVFNADYAPSAPEVSNDDNDSLAVPRSALSPPALSSHFAVAPGPTPALDSPLPYPPVHTEHSVDSPVHSGDERVDLVDEAPIRVGVAPDEMQDESLVGRARPLGGAVDASAAGIALAHEQEDAEMGGEETGEGGLLIIDDDELAPFEQQADGQDASPVDLVSPVEAERIVVGATPPPAAEPADEEPPIVDGVAPPQNPSLLPEPAPPSPPTLGDALADAEDAAPSSAHAASSAEPQAVDELRFEDFVELDSSSEDDDDDNDSDEEVLLSLVPNRSTRQSPQAGEPAPVGPVLGLPAGEEVGAGEATAPLADEDDDEAASPAPPSSDDGGMTDEPALEGETVQETAVDLLEAGEVDAAREAEGPRAPSQAPSSEPLSYRSEDDVDDLVFLEPERGDGYGEQDDLADSSLHIHGVTEPGEWDPSDAIRFGGAAEEPVEEQEAAVRGSSVVEVDTDGEAMQPSEVVSVRGASASSDRDHAQLDVQALDSPIAPESADEEASFSAEPAQAEQDGDQDAATHPASPHSFPPPPTQQAAVDKSVEAIKAQATPRRTRSAGISAPVPFVELPSPARRSNRLSSVPATPAEPSGSSSKPQTPAARKRSRKDEAAAAPSSSAKRARRSLPQSLAASASDSESEIVAAIQPSATAQARHHHHAAAADEPQRSKDAPITRSHCAWVRLRIRSREGPRAPPYLFQLPSCALVAPIARETIRAFDVENLGVVDESDGCEGIQLGGHADADDFAANSLHEALVPHRDVLAAIRRIAGKDLWHEGACEVLPREEKHSPKGGKGKGKKRAAGDAALEEGATPGSASKSASKRRK